MARQTSLTEKFLGVFTPALRRRAAKACAARVELADADEVYGFVAEGEDFWEVELGVVGRRLKAICECPEGQRGRLCAHVWAMLAKAEEQGELAAARKASVSGKTIFVVDEIEDEDEDEPEEDAGRGWDEGRERRVAEMERMARSLGSLLGAIARGSGGLPVPSLQKAGETDIHLLAIPPADRQGRKLEVQLFWSPAGKPPVWDERHRYTPEATHPTGGFLGLLEPFRINRPSWDRYGKKKEEGQSPRYLLEGGAARTVLRQLAQTERLHVATGKGTAAPVDWSDPAPCAFVPHLKRTGDQYEAGAVFCGANVVVQLHEVVFLGDAFALAPGRGFEFLAGSATREMRRLFEAGGTLLLSEQEARDWAVRWRMEGGVPMAGIDPDLRPEVRQVAPRPRVHVRTAQFKYRGREQLHLDLSFDYDGQAVAEKAKGYSVRHGDSIVVRDRDAESQAADVLGLLGCRLNTNLAKEELGWKLSPQDLDRLVWELVERDWLVTAEGKTYRRPVEKELAVGAGTDWLELRGGVEFGGQKVPLPTLLAAARKGASAVRLDDGTYGLLPREWLEKYTALIELGEVVEGAIRFRQAQAALLDALLDRRDVEGAEALDDSRRALASFAGAAPADPPAAFAGTLREYQRSGLGWLLALRDVGLGGCLADDMGLGKTIQVLALLADSAQTRPGPSLVVAPKSLLFNWESEAARFAPELRVRAHHGAGRARQAEELADVDLLLTTYGTLRQDVEFLASIPFHYAILDESQAIKNADTATAKCTRALRAEHRLVMTGTPVENRLQDLFSQFEFLNPGIFGASAFLARIMRGADSGTSEAAAVGKALRPLILRRTKTQVVKELPAKTEQVLFCELGEEQRREYDRLRDYYRDKVAGNEGGGQMAVIEALLRLRQVACHPGLVSAVGENIPSAKLDLLFEELDTLREEGRKALVFSQFTSLLHRVESDLQTRGVGYCYLDGGTKDRGEVVRRFQEDPAAEIFLISLKAGGVGLNLTAADTVFLLDPWWNPAAEAQAIDRAHRIGQDQPVFAYRIIARDTVEEKVLDLQNRKRELAAAVVGDEEGFAAALTAEDLRLLLG